MFVSVIMPVYNEQDFVEEIVKRVLRVDIPKELIIVDDFSTDGTREILKGFTGVKGIKIHFHEKNMGKGAALRTGFSNAIGDIILIQDADLEYNPMEYTRLIQPIVDNIADVVYGSRFVGGDAHRVLFFWHMVGNKFLTLLSNMFSNLNLTDMETCYKVFRKDVLDRITIKENRFGFEPEITAKLAKLNARIYEMGISYSGRDYGEGKKIDWKDGFRALWCIFKYNLFN
jgi:glycosyltransferase involved in cell wall biosynthesis